jgi:pimeloyl-ACP methyl ester carboxylesterase
MTISIKRLLVPTPSVNGETKKPHQIAYTDWGDPENPHVVICVHGLTRNCRDFDNFAQAFATNCRVICVDVVGRGQSDWLEHAEDYDYYPLYLSDAAALLAHIKSQYNADIKLDWVGISMGGLIGMALAIQSDIPVPINKLVMSDIGPFIPMSALSRMSKYVGKDIRFKSFDELEDYIKRIAAPFGPLTEAQWHHMAVHSVREYSDGSYGFRYDPKVSVSFKAHVLRDIDLWAYWDKLTVPTFVLRGADSDVLSDRTAEEMKTRGARATVVNLPGIGHAPVLMDSQQVDLVKGFLLASTASEYG